MDLTANEIDAASLRTAFLLPFQSGDVPSRTSEHARLFQTGMPSTYVYTLAYRSICAFINQEIKMPTVTLPGPEDCNCFAVRSAARHVTQLYDQLLAPVGLRITQFSILAKLKRRGPLTINALGDDILMDRTTLGRNTQSLFELVIKILLAVDATFV
jgi:hypothetical protein